MFALREGAHIHLIGICGTAMGSLAGMLAECGYRVTGSDSRVYPPMSDFLAHSGIAVQEGFDEAGLSPAPDLIVVGNAVSRGNPEVEATLDRRLPYTSLPEILRDLFLRSRRTVVVTGTHGKTTTTALTAFLLEAGGLDPSFLIAGIPMNFARPYRLADGEHFVVEGDEYDSAFFAKFPKFYCYRPDLLIINNIEFDHADIYTDLAEIERAFGYLINTVPRGGLVLANGDDPVIAPLLLESPAPVLTFGLGEDCDWRATDLQTHERGQQFSAACAGCHPGRFELALTGEHNVRNALAAMAAASHLGVAAHAIAPALTSFRGIRRRQEMLLESESLAVIDDFAHHPTAVEQTLAGLRRAYPTRRLWAVFEPASASNARAIFEARYEIAFAAADRTILAAVPRPERARGDSPFSPDRVVAQLRQGGREADAAVSKEAILAQLVAEVSAGDVIVFMSNGGFGGIQRQFVECLSHERPELV